jgi:hypothetical protein
MVKIKSPNPQYTGVSASLHFVNGEAETDNKWLIGWFENKGYEVIEDEDKTGKPLSEMTHAELDAFASEKNVPEDQYPKSGNKEEKATAIEKFLSGE